jgi:hypothetical protein
MSRCRLRLANPVFLKSSLLIALCACLVLVADCEKRRPGWRELNFNEEISPQPPRVGPVTVSLRLTDLSGKAVTGAQLTMEADMSHPGMVPVFADANEIEPGHYQAIMKLPMAGDWRVTVHVIMSGNHKEDYDFDIKGVQPRG